jgi:cell wall-associated NlpC family hydrolase
MKTLPREMWIDLLGKPFADSGRGPDVYDCVGLMIAIERRLGRDIPDWGSHVRLLAGALSRWEKITPGTEQPGDGILFRSSDPPWHIGVVYGQGYMLHASPDAGEVVRVRYNLPPWQGRIEGIYRWTSP